MHTPTFRRRSALLIALTAGLAACNGQEPGGTTSFSVMLKDAPGDVQHAFGELPAPVDALHAGEAGLLQLLADRRRVGSRLRIDLERIRETIGSYRFTRRSARTA